MSRGQGDLHKDRECCISQSFFYAYVVLLKIDNVMTKFDRRIKTDKSTFPIWETIQEVLSKTFLKDVMSLMSCGL